MKGLTAKVFRTYNASYTFQEELKKIPADGTVAEKILAYNRANRQVAVLCNHQRSVPKSHSNQLSKLQDKVSQCLGRSGRIPKCYYRLKVLNTRGSW